MKMETAATDSGRVRTWRLVRGILLAIVLGVVGWRASVLWDEGQSLDAEVNWQPAWLVAAAAAYLAG